MSFQKPLQESCKTIATLYHSPIGDIKLTFSQNTLVGLSFVEADDECRNETSLQCHKKVVQWLDDYFCGKVPKTEDLDFSLEGTAFQQKVWQELLKIPYGSTTNYGHLAHVVAKNMGVEKMSAQAVGNAIGRNPIAIVVPCHRVIGANGTLTGYAWGIERKKFLLDNERGARKQ